VIVKFVRKTGSSGTIGDSPALFAVDGGRSGYILQGDDLTAEERAEVAKLPQFNPAERHVWIAPDVIQG
jgi:hypothetical protein